MFFISTCTPRHQDVPTRSRYVRLVDNVRDNGGNVRYQLSLKKKKKCLHLPRSGRISNEIFSFSSFLAEYFLAFMCQVNVSYETTHIIINSTLKIHVEFFL